MKTKTGFAFAVAQSLRDAHETFEATMKDVTSSMAQWQPQGKALSIASLYVHGVVTEDVIVNAWIRKKKPLLLGVWAKKMGLNQPHPEMDADWEKNYTKWTKTMKVDLKKFRAYATAVYKASDTYLSGLTDKDMDKIKIDLSMWGMGDWPLGRFAMRFLISHIDSLCGEISAAKGLQGKKGYPF